MNWIVDFDSSVTDEEREHLKFISEMITGWTWHGIRWFGVYHGRHRMLHAVQRDEPANCFGQFFWPDIQRLGADDPDHWLIGEWRHQQRHQCRGGCRSVAFQQLPLTRMQNSNV